MLANTVHCQYNIIIKLDVTVSVLLRLDIPSAA